MTSTLTWVVLPDGFNPDTGRARLSLVAAPEAVSDTGMITDSVLAGWPTLVAAARNQLFLRVKGFKNQMPMVPVGEAPRQELWSAVFPPAAPLDPPPPDTYGHFEALTTALPYAKAHDSARALYDEALATSPTERMGRDHPVARKIAALGRLTASVGGDAAARAAAGLPGAVNDLLDPDALSPGRVDDAVAALTAAGLVDEAAVAPLAPIVVRQRRAAEANVVPPPDGPVPPPPPPPVRDLAHADVHQVIGLIGDHPAIARLLGLTLDFEVAVNADLFGERSIRVVDASGQFPLASSFTVTRHPWSNVGCDASSGQFAMARHPLRSEVLGGLLDLRPGGADYAVGDLDVRSIARQLVLIASTMPDDGDADAATPGSGPSAVDPGVALPVRRDPGLVLAQAGRRDGVVASSLALAERMAPSVDQQAGAAVDEDVALFTDDVTAGYRVDVERDGGPFRSIMRRVATYTVAGARPETLEVHDEGMVEPVTGVVEATGNGTSTMTVGEEVAAWDGWSAVAPLPGPPVMGDEAGGDTVGTPEQEALEGYGLTVRTAVEPNSLPALRYGSTYRFRARAVDLAGNSRPESDPDATLATAPVTFRRHEPVPPPVIVPRTPFRVGEDLTRIVVTSDGDGRLLGATSERHLAPPSIGQRMAERHGVFDAAFGPDSPERTAARQAMLTLASRESGSFTDPTVPGPDGQMVPARGIAVVAPPGEAPATLPVPKGDGLPAGQYVIHDTDTLVVPYLPDPGARGVTLLTPFAGPEGFEASYGSGPWPERRPIRLVARAVTEGPTDVRTLDGPGGQVLDVPLAPGEVWRAAVSSSIPASVVDVMDPTEGTLRKLAMRGLVLAFSPRQEVTMLHATRKPTQPPTLAVTTIGTRFSGDTAFRFDADLTVHGKTTGSLDAVATWTEVTDHGIGDLEVEEHTVVLDSRTVNEGDTALHATLRHDFGDTRRRDLTVTPVGATRFRDVFPDLPVGHPDTLRHGTGQSLIVKNTRRPAPPDIHSVVPLYTWTRTLADGVYTSRRSPAGIRVYLKRPWLTTGPGERLGVVTYASTLNSIDAGNPANPHPSTRFTSRVSPDVLETGAPAPNRMQPGRFVGSANTYGFVPRELPNMGPNDPKLVVIEYDVHFNAERGLWYADVQFPDDFTAHPSFAQLALVRSQFFSEQNSIFSRIERTDWVPLAGMQKLTVSRTGPDSVLVRVHEVSPDRRYTAALEPRLRPRPPDAPKDLEEMDVTLPAGPETELKLRLQAPGPGVDPHTMEATVAITATDPQERARLAAGRLVVREAQTGEDIRKPGGASRPVWLDTVDWADLFT